MTRRSALAALAGELVYQQAEPGYHYSFPRDHFEHPAFRTEWWYYTGNLRDARNHRFGFELVFFRQAQRRGPSANRSVWRVDDLYLAHLALADIEGKRFRYTQRLNRAGPGIAGASFARRRVWNGNWSAQWNGEAQVLEATAAELRFRLKLSPLKPPVIHGENGVNRKAEAPGAASCYVSFTRLTVAGELDDSAVRGTAWMDHEWFTHQLAANQAGWDWFSVQLDDGRDLMLFELRRKDGSIDPYSAGSFVDPEGRALHLRREEFALEPREYWTSPRTGARYPIRWRIRVPRVGIDLDCAAALAQQELVAETQSTPNYWEGAVTYSGSASGVGYLEMTGYDKPAKI